MVIERKLKDQQYGGTTQAIYEYLDELSKFQAFASDNMPPGPHKGQTLSEFSLKALAEASEYLMRTLSNELQLQKTISEESIGKLRGELKDVKDEHRAKIDFFESKLRALEMERAEALAKE